MIIYTFEYWLARRGLTAIAGTTFIRAILLPAIIIHHFHFHFSCIVFDNRFITTRPHELVIIYLSQSKKQERTLTCNTKRYNCKSVCKVKTMIKRKWQPMYSFPIWIHLKQDHTNRSKYTFQQLSRTRKDVNLCLNSFREVIVNHMLQACPNYNIRQQTYNYKINDKCNRSV